MISPELIRCKGVTCLRRAMVERVYAGEKSDGFSDRWCGVIDVGSMSLKVQVRVNGG